MIDDLALALVGGMRAFMGLACLIAAATFGGGLLRVLGGKRRGGDRGRAWLTAMMLSQVGFVVYWITLGRDNLAPLPVADALAWATCYAVTGISAIGLMHVMPRDPDTTPMRGTSTPAMAGLWAIIATACVGVSWLEV